MKRNQVKVNLAEWGACHLDGDLLVAIEKLQKLISDNPNCFDFKIDVETESGWYGECSTNFSIYAYRWETDDEYNQRIEQEKSHKEYNKIMAKQKAEAEEKRQRSLYETLKKKFENL